MRRLRRVHRLSREDIIADRPHETDLANEFVAIIVDAMFTQGGTIRIGHEDKPAELVKSTLQKLTYEKFEHALDKFIEVRERITNKKKYILTMLYNSMLNARLTTRTLRTQTCTGNRGIRKKYEGAAHDNTKTD